MDITRPKARTRVSDRHVDLQDTLYAAERFASILYEVVESVFAPKSRQPPKTGSGFVFFVDENNVEDLRFVAGELLTSVMEARIKHDATPRQ
jgi:hypothetical protein